MTSRQGGTKGGGQGGREFSLTASLTKLPAPTSGDGAQGGKTGDTSGTRKTSTTGNGNQHGGAPSPANVAALRSITSSRSVISAASDANGEKVRVHVPREPPALTPSVCRTLLEILVELTAVEVLDRPAGKGTE